MSRRHKVEYDIGTQAAAAALDQLINKAERLNHALGKAAAALGKNAAYDPGVQSMLTEMSMTQGAMSGLRAVQASVLQSGQGLSSAAIRDAMLQGARLGANDLEKAIDGGASTIQELMAVAGGAGAGIAPSGAGSANALVSSVLDAARIPAQGGGVGVLAAFGRLGMGNAANFRGLFSPGTMMASGIGLAGHLAGAMLEASVMAGRPMFEAETRLMAAAASGQWVHPTQALFDRSAARSEGNLLFQRHIGSTYEWLPVLGPAMRALNEPMYRDLEREVEMKRAIGRGAVTRQMIGAITGQYDLLDPTGPDAQTLDQRYSMVRSLAAFGQRATRAADDLDYSGALRRFSPEMVAAVGGSATHLGLDPAQIEFRRALMSGRSLPSLAPMAMGQLAGMGDLAGIAAWLPMSSGREVQSFLDKAAGILDSRGRAALAGADVDTSSARMETALLTRMPSQVSGADVKAALSEVVAALKQGAAQIKDVAGENSLAYKQARAQVAQAELALRQVDPKLASLRADEARARFGLKTANIGVTGAMVDLYSTDPADIDRVGAANISAMNEYQSALRRQIPHMSPMEAIKAREEIKSIERQKISGRADVARDKAHLTDLRFAPLMARGQADVEIASLYGTDAEVQGAFGALGRRVAQKMDQLRKDLIIPHLDKGEKARIEAEIEQLRALQAGLSAGARGTELHRQGTRSLLAIGETGNAVHRAIRVGSAGDVRAAVDEDIRAINSRIQEIDDQINRGGLSFDQENALKRERQALERKSFDSRQAGIDSTYQKEDLVGFGRDAMILSHIERRATATAFSPVNLFTFKIAGVRMRNRRINELQGRLAALAASGDLSPERQFAIESEIMEMGTQNVEAIASIGEGMENRMPALSAGRPGFFARIDSLGMAAMAYRRIGFPRRGHGAVSGAHAAEQDRFVESLGAGHLGPWSRTAGFNNGGGTERIEGLLERILAAIESGGDSGGHPGEMMGRAWAGMQGKNLNRASRLLGAN